MVSFAFYTNVVLHHNFPILKKNNLNPAFIVCPQPNKFARYKIPCLSANDPDRIKKMQDEGVEFIIVSAWSFKLPKSEYENFPKGGWNIHCSLLPTYRGAHPIFWTLANGETETGITIHQLTDRIDAGPILMQKKLAINAMDTYQRLYLNLNHLETEMICDAVTMIHDNNFQLTDQKPGTYPKAPRVKPEHLKLTPNMTMTDCRNLIRAANPVYGANFKIGPQSLKIFEVASEPDGEGPVIPCKDGNLVATVLTLAKVGAMSGRTYLRKYA